MKDLGWAWKEDKDQTKPTVNKPKKRKKKKRVKKQKPVTSCFYQSKEWRSLRYRVLRKYGGECMLCGRSKRQHNVVLHVDHIKPRLNYPELELCFDNLQVLCEDCNLGKSYKDYMDWRPTKEDEEMGIVYEANKHI